MVTTLGRPAPEDAAREGLTARPAIGPLIPRPTTRRWIGGAFVIVGLAEGVWVTLLSVALPALAKAEHWTAAWAVLDTGEALGLFATGRLLLRYDKRCALTAGAAAVFLLSDAWIDISTSTAGAPRALAVTEACVAEVPLAFACSLLALYVVRHPSNFHRGN